MSVSSAQPNCRRFDGQVALVTGAAQGVGKATAIRLAAEGASVLVVDRAEPQGQAVVDEIVAAGGSASLALADLETWEGAESVVNACVEQYGRVDVAVHNVGGTIWAKPYHLYPIEQIEKEMQRSLWPTMWGCRAVIPQMVKQGSGSIVNIGSVATRGINRVPYSAAKGGIAAITVCLAMELAEHNIRVNCVAPGGVDGGERAVPRNLGLSDYDQIDADGIKGVMEQTFRDTPMGRMGSPDELAAAIAYMASPDASYVTGEVMHCSGGGTGLK
ncbi:MAG TPA: 1,6-dihydroxycyclohexa-2,4-diene-1-carboxylate dehydrogenase [Gammaproteobacteria bacterium]|nr:1,6-dihydroxycyclohexa-2,4-diene-1-carboxylate dehydrogenase [Gammaproteobacteria bacterium]